MLNIHKNKGISLIELMVAVGLGLILVLSMLAFYSISSQNVVDFQQASHSQQQIRKMMNLLETDIENTGGFECATPDQVYAYTNSANILRAPTNIISLGDDITRKQIVFAHPVIAEYKHTALGMLDFDKSSGNLKSYTPIHIKDAGCGQDQSPIYIGTTVLEMLPMDGIITTNTEYSSRANNIMAFVALSAVQSRRANNDTTEVLYTPTMNDATVMFLSNTQGAPDDTLLPFGNNNVDILLGFSLTGKGNTHVPDTTFDDAQNILNGEGGWINPFSSQTNNRLLIDDTNQKANLINQALHNKNTDLQGYNINTYPLKGANHIIDKYSNQDLVSRVRAIKFVFTFGAHDDVPERILTRVIRFKNTHLMKFD